MKNKYLILGVIAATVCFACEKQTESSVEDPNRPCVLSAGIENTSTRVSVDTSTLVTSWTSRDAIKLQTGDGDNDWADYTLNSGAGTKMGTFGGNGTPGGDQLAVYPGGRLNNRTFTFPSSFTYATADGNGNLINTNNGKEYGSTVVSEIPMVAKVKGSAGKYHCSFNYVAGAIKVTYKDIPMDAKRLVLEAQGSPLTGTAQLNGTQPLSIEDGGNRIEVAFNDGSHSYAGKALSFMIPVPAGTYDRIRMWVDRYYPEPVLGFPQYYSRIPGSGVGTKTGVDITINAGKVYDMGIVGAGDEVYIFDKVTAGTTLSEGTYILVYEVPNSNTVIVNSSSTNQAVFVREAENGEIKLHYAEYVAGIWVVQATPQQDGQMHWTISAARYGSDHLDVNVHWENGYVEIEEPRYSGTTYTRYISYANLNDRNFKRTYEFRGTDYSGNQYKDGEFIATTGLDDYPANISLYKLNMND